MGIARDVFVQPIHVFPGFVLAHHLHPARNVEEAGAGRVRVRHDDVTLVNRLGQVFPIGRDRQAVFLALDRVEANRRNPRALADPLRGLVDLVVEFGLQLVEALGCIPLEITFVAEQHQAGGGETPHDVGLRVVFFGHQLGRHDTRGIANPVDGHAGRGALEGFFEAGEFIGFHGGVDRQFFGLDGRGGHQADCRDAERQTFEEF